MGKKKKTQKRERVEEKQTLLKAGSVLGIEVQNSKSPPGVY
jgi:hypothetical protein